MTSLSSQEIIEDQNGWAFRLEWSQTAIIGDKSICQA